MNPKTIERTRALRAKIEAMITEHWKQAIQDGVDDGDIVAEILGSSLSNALQYAAALNLPVEKLLTMYQVALTVEQEIAAAHQDGDQNVVTSSSPSETSKLN